VVGLAPAIVGLVAINLLVPHFTGNGGLNLAPAFLVAGFGGDGDQSQR
jgi:hypothetical protein